MNIFKYILEKNEIENFMRIIIKKIYLNRVWQLLQFYAWFVATHI